MGEAHRAADDLGRSLTADFSAWVSSNNSSSELFFRNGLVVLDANVLLDLYRIAPEARRQVLDAFRGVTERLWVPHQAAIEFSRNRKGAVIGRVSSFKQARQALRNAKDDAIDILESAIERLLELREQSGKAEPWDIANAGLDREGLLERLDGVMDPAIAELEALESEHDLHPGDMQRIDPLFEEIDTLLAGHIGASYPFSELRILVEEAHAFRFPNEIPPGYRDIDKKTMLGAAGDYLLWRQTIDKAIEMETPDKRVLLITSELKSDWWELDEKGRPRGPRPELVQELRDLAHADLLLLSLKEFIAGTKEHLSSTVSDRTLDELSEIGAEDQEFLSNIFRDSSNGLNLLDLSFQDFERLIGILLARMGYEFFESGERVRTFDFFVSHKDNPSKRIIVEAKRYRTTVGLRDVQSLYGAMHMSNADSGMLITTSSFSPATLAAAQGLQIELIDGERLLALLADHGFTVTTGLDN
jgi:PIN like domain/Restriction endonuclease